MTSHVMFCDTFFSLYCTNGLLNLPIHVQLSVQELSTCERSYHYQRLAALQWAERTTVKEFFFCGENLFSCEQKGLDEGFFRAGQSSGPKKQMLWLE